MRLTAIFAAAAIATMAIAPSTRALAQAAYEQRLSAQLEAEDAKFDFYVVGYRRCDEQVMATTTARLKTAAATLRRLANDAKAGRNELNPEDSERIARSVEEDLRQVRLLPFTTCEQTWQVRQAEEQGTPPPSGPRTVRGRHLLDAARVAAQRCDKQRLEESRERLRQLANDARDAIDAEGATVDAQNEARRDFANLQGLIIQATLLELKNCPKTQPATPPEPPLPPAPDPNDQSLGARIARAAIAHAAAAAACDEVEMQRRLQELKQLEAEAKSQSKASKAVGEFAAVSPEQAAKDLKSASDELRNATLRKPENCPKTQEQPKTEAKPTPPPPPPPKQPLQQRTPETPEQQQQQQEEPAEEPLLMRWVRLLDTADSIVDEHIIAARMCNIPLMRLKLIELRTIAEEMRKIARGAKAAGAFSGLDAKAAQNAVERLARLVREAEQRKPENCPEAAKPKEVGVLPPPQQPAPEQQLAVLPGDPRLRIIFDEHNKARAEVGSPPLSWDPLLAAGAAAYAVQLTTRGRVHAPREGRKDVRENILQTGRGVHSPKGMFGVLLAEKRHYKPGIFPDVSTTGDWSSVGHYTQIIWRATKRVGCAIHSDARYDWLVCRYSPPGNQDGRPVL